ncbi:hypothetical protein AVEN_4140-1 [Araneus ventricosus]|uniref:Uncharacterized protein n=1 Tax=Araneus ventricosus TaxID=182803 RepID=A0A4Y2TUN2_ARAVE|nr:hypothetical protein AVEN_4140-1 [Araneus ventricosus]
MVLADRTGTFRGIDECDNHYHYGEPDRRGQIHSIDRFSISLPFKMEGSAAVSAPSQGRPRGLVQAPSNPGVPSIDSTMVRDRTETAVSIITQVTGRANIPKIICLSKEGHKSVSGINLAFL